MKVCDITKFYAPTSGGVKTYLHGKADYLAAVGWEHVLIVPGAAHSCCSEGPRRLYTVRGPLIPGRHPYRLLLNARQVRRILAAEQPDLIEIGSPYFVPWVLSLALGRRFDAHGRPALTGFYHADFPQTYVRGYGRRLGTGVQDALESVAWAYARAVYGRCDAVIAASQHIAYKLGAHGVGPVHRVPLGTDPECLTPARRSAALRQELDSDDRQLLLYVGRLSYEKDLETLLAAFDRLPADGYRLVLVGDGPERPAVEAFARLRTNVTYLGYCKDARRLAAIYASCDLFVAPGRHETFGLTVLEAFASGLPVLGVAGGAVAELIEPGTGAVVAPHDPAALAVGVERLCASAGLAGMGRCARELVVQRYGWPATFRRLCAVYEDLVAAHRGRT